MISSEMPSFEPTIIANELISISPEPAPTNTTKSMSRWKAALIHLSLSVVMAIAVVLLLYFVWYPQPFFDASGGKFLLSLMIAVDVILGPLITLIIFNTKKKSLKFDLAFIAFVQIAALCYGVYTMYLARPAFVVFALDQFTVISANDVDQNQLAKVTRPEFKSVPLTGPKFAYSVPQTAGKDLEGMQLSMLGFAPQYYVPYADKSIEAVSEGKPIADLYKGWPQAKDDVEAVLKSQNKHEADVVFVKVVAKLMVMAAILDAKSGSIISIVPLNKL
jgi:hypothetical protein